ncbi:uncharacterized protein J3D65DRAFT_96809 [Phyllosticta citribraziliensis]|uniref:Uncharacterized protein n=1 Tax=Phyllosticta citribraziliensis TaxID=989973 RepID=A0ABR1LAD9_9PEZI
MRNATSPSLLFPFPFHKTTYPFHCPHVRRTSRLFLISFLSLPLAYLVRQSSALPVCLPPPSASAAYHAARIATLQTRPPTCPLARAAIPYRTVPYIAPNAMARNADLGPARRPRSPSLPSFLVATTAAAAAAAATITRRSAQFAKPGRQITCAVAGWHVVVICKAWAEEGKKGRKKIERGDRGQEDRVG